MLRTTLAAAFTLALARGAETCPGGDVDRGRLTGVRAVERE